MSLFSIVDCVLRLADCWVGRASVRKAFMIWINRLNKETRQWHTHTHSAFCKDELKESGNSATTFTIIALYIIKLQNTALSQREQHGIIKVLVYADILRETLQSLLINIPFPIIQEFTFRLLVLTIKSLARCCAGLGSRGLSTMLLSSGSPGTICQWSNICWQKAWPWVCVRKSVSKPQESMTGM